MKKLLSLILIVISIYANGQCWSKVAAGYNHTIALRTNGTLWGCGNNSFGQLGVGIYFDISSTFIQIGTATNWQTIATGNSFTLAIKTNGTLWEWGSIGAETLSPVQIGSATNWAKIEAGPNYALAIKTDGTLWAWGNNVDGQLGDGSIITRLSPIQIGTATNWVAISAGGHSLAIKSDGTLWAWGSNNYGQLGDGTLISKSIPTQIGTATNWQSIAVSGRHSVAIKTDGSLWAWGYNYFGQLGYGNTINYSIPMHIGIGTNWQTIEAGSEFTIAKKSDGSIWAWGENCCGQLTGNETQLIVPTRIGVESNWLLSNAGSIHSVAIKNDNSLYTWGSNYYGQLGIGTIYSSNVLNQISCAALENEMFNGGNFTIFPNPVKGILNIENLTNVAIETITIIDVIGKKILQQKGNISQINIEGLERGIYLLELDYEGGKQIEKFIKE